MHIDIWTSIGKNEENEVNGDNGKFKFIHKMGDELNAFFFRRFFNHLFICIDFDAVWHTHDAKVKRANVNNGPLTIRFPPFFSI